MTLPPAGSQKKGLFFREDYLAPPATRNRSRCWPWGMASGPFPKAWFVREQTRSYS